jgi:hypothetical protein
MTTTIQDATLGPVGNVHIEGGTSNQVLTSDGNNGVTWTNPRSDVHVIDWQAAYGNPAEISNARFQGSAKYTIEPGSALNPLTNIVELTSGTPNKTGTLSWWYPLLATDYFTIRATTRVTKVSDSDQVADGVTMYFASMNDGYWKIERGMSVTMDEYGSGFQWTNNNIPCSVVWFQNNSAVNYAGCPVPTWNLYDSQQW